MIADIEVTDPDTYAKYAAGVPATVAGFGGKYLVRGDQGEVAEGTWAPKRLVVLEFESMERAKAWYNSPEYQAALPMSLEAARGTLFMFPGE